MIRTILLITTLAAQAPQEAIEQIEPVTAQPAAKEAPKTLPVVLGRMHPSLVHMPIGWLLLTLLCEVLVIGFKRHELRAAGLYIVVGTALSFVPAIASGLLRVQEYAEEPDIMDPALLHRNVMFLTFGFVLIAMAIRIFGRNRLHTNLRYVYLATLVCAVVAVTIGGHLGGKLVYGDEYLPY